MASKWRKPLLIGTTGHSEKGKEQMKEASRSIPILHSPNFSSGMRSSLDAVKKISDALGSDFKAEIIETHHKHKKDTPSGSALALKALMERQTPIQSIREGEVIGEHRILFTSPEEMIEIKHVVLSRNAFAKGAIQAALFLATQPVGFYE
jgi:4-hydroxy-tetrahydrodipicolinate reductase